MTVPASRAGRRGRSPPPGNLVRRVAVGVAVAAALAAAAWFVRGDDAAKGRERGPRIDATEATEAPPTFPRPRTEDERIGALLQVMLTADDEDAAWARGRLVEAGEPARERVLELAKESVATNRAFVGQAFDVLLVAPRASDVPFATVCLRSDDPDIVKRACLLLGQLGPAARSAVPELASAAAGAYPVPSFACDALVRVGGDAALAALARAARDAEAGPSARAFALLALGRMPDAAAGDALREAYAVAAGDERYAVAEALVLRGDPAPIADLRAAFATDRDERAFVLLSRAADPLAFREIERRVRDPFEPPVRRIEACTQLESFPHDARASLLRELGGDRSQVRDVRVEAWDVLVRGGDARDEADLLGMLRAEGPSAQHDRYVAALVIGRLRRRAHARAVVEALDAPGSEPEVRTKTACALALIGAPETAETLVRLLAADRSGHDVPDSMAVNLGSVLRSPSREFGAALGPAALRALRGEFGTPGPRAQFEVLQIVGRCCGPEAAPAAEALLTVGDRHLREAAAAVLAYVGGPDSERAVRSAWWQPQDPYTRRALAVTLHRLSLRPLP